MKYHQIVIEYLNKGLRLIILFIAWSTTVFLSREVTIIGLENIPEKGPVILVPNHSNQFADVACISSTVKRHVYYLGASILKKQVFMRFCSAICGVIPVMRPHDFATKKTGRIRIGSNGVVTGIDTKFLSEVQLKESVKVKGRKELMVTEVLSNTCLKVDTTSQSILPPVEKGDDFNEYYIIPIVDQRRCLEDAIKGIKEGQLICVFAEGGSHDQSDLMPLRPGAAITGLSAIVDYGIEDLKIIPVGLKYSHQNLFRARATVEYKEPTKIDPSLIEEYKMDRRSACTKLMNQIENEMRSVMHTAPSHQEKRDIALARKLILPTPEESSFTRKEIVDFEQTLYTSYRNLNSEKCNVGQLDYDYFKDVVAEVHKYGRALKNAKLRDSQVYLAQKSKISAYGFIFHLTRLVMVFSIILPGLISLIPFLVVLCYLVRRQCEIYVNAICSRTTKSADSVLSNKVIYSFALYPIQTTLLCILLGNLFFTESMTWYCIPSSELLKMSILFSFAYFLYCFLITQLWDYVMLDVCYVCVPLHQLLCRGKLNNLIKTRE